MEIKILSTGCFNCNTLEKTVRLAVSEMGIEADIEKIDDLQRIMSYGILRSPALVINEKIVASGRVPSITEIKALIRNFM